MSSNRREFLRAIPGAAITGAIGNSAISAATKVTVGAHPWVYAAPLPGYDITPVLDQIFSDLTYAGVDGVELMHTALRRSDAVPRIRKLSRKYNLPVIGTSYEAPMYDRARHAGIFEDARAVIQRVAELGGKTLGTSVGDAGRKKTPAELDAQAQLVRKLTAVCNQNGVTLNLHNHIYEVKDGEYDLKGTLARIPDAKLGPDIDWLVGAGVNPVDFVHRHAGRMVYAHLRDRKADGVWSEAMGEGNIDYAAVGRAFHQINFAGTLTIELAHPKGFQPTRPIRESIRMSREYVRRVMGY
jgi:sugar phosphate isomerase/epimerase